MILLKLELKEDNDFELIWEYSELTVVGGSPIKDCCDAVSGGMAMAMMSVFGGACMFVLGEKSSESLFI
jgi:hypothetical protein